MLVETEPPTGGQKVEKEKTLLEKIPVYSGPERVLHFGFGTHDGPSLLMAKGIVSLLERICRSEKVKSPALSFFYHR